MGENTISNIILEQRGKISVSGVYDMDNFSDHLLALNTELGYLEIRGNNFHLSKLNLEVGEVILDGEIDSVVYAQSGGTAEKSGFFSKMFGV